VITIRLQWTPQLRHSVGRPIRGRTLTIVDSGGRALPPGQVGEAIVRSSALARAYLGPSAGGSVIAGDQLITGDLGWTNEDGELFLTGRKTSLIHAGGALINPTEIEAVIAAAPGVHDVAVVGVPDPDQGEQVKAVVVAPELGAEDVLRYCRQHLAASWLPQVIEFRDRIPRTPAGKIIRRALRPSPMPYP
jgi:long-chain acyl-CoA synthetase